LNPWTLKPRARVAAKLSVEPTTIQLVGGASVTALLLFAMHDT
jgi:hypothetical protein